MTKKARKTGKRCLALFMTVLMLMSAWVFVAPTAKADASTGQYKIRLLVKCTNDYTPGGNNRVVVYYKGGNGTNSTTSSTTISLGDDPDPYKNVFEGSDNNFAYYPSTDGTWIDGFPTSMNLYIHKTSGAVFSTDGAYTCYLQVWKDNGWADYGGTQEAKDGCNYSNLSDSYANGISNQSVSVSSTGEGSNSNSVSTPSSAYPSISSGTISVSGANSFCSGTSPQTYTATLNNCKDQYGTTWVGSPTSWSSNNTSRATINSSGVASIGTQGGAVTFTANYPGKTGTKSVNVYYRHSLTKTSAVEPTCTASGNYDYWTCSICSGVFSDANGTAATTVAAQTRPALGHDWQWVTDNEPTCTTNGKKHEKCSRCNATQSLNTSIPSLGHDWVETTEVTFGVNHLKTAATCEAAAVYYKSCSRCGANSTETFTSGNPLGHRFTGGVHYVGPDTHNWACANDCGSYGTPNGGKNATAGCQYGEWSADTATCTVGGTQTRTCQVCSHVDSRNTNQLGHSWGTPTYTWANDGSSCTAQRVCARDSSHKETESGAISSSVTTPATCEQMGKTTYTATFTNTAFSTQTKVVEDVPELGHSWKYSEAVFNWNGYACPNATLTCARDANHTTTVDTTVTSTITVSPTCEGTGVRTYTAKFTVNGTNYTSQRTETINPNGHDWNYAGATYSWSGYSSCTAHVVCNTDSSHTIDIPATSISSSVTTTATCVVDGIRTYTATFDNNQLITQTKDENLGKDLNNHVHTHNVAATTSTCQDHGYTAGVFCDDCQTYISGHQQLPLVDHKYTNYTYNDDATCTADGTETASCDYNCGTTDTRTKAGTAKGHDYTGATISTGENGGHKYLCNNGCGTYGKVEGSTQVTDGVEAHTWGSYTVLTSATCGDPGLARYTCTKCTQTHTEPIPATGLHTWVAGTATPATCVATGTQPYECSVCHATKSDTLPIDATNHSDLQHVAAKDATCLVAGNIEYWHCSGCGNYYDDAAGTSQIEQLDTVIAKLEHSYTGAIQNNNNGTHSFKCVNGCNQYGGTVACTYGEPVINPVATCQTHGIQTETCLHCGYDKVTDLGLGDHNWSAWVQTTAPTCTEKGEETRHCQTPNCGEEETRDVDPLGHNWSTEWTIDLQPGCTTAGSKSHHCLRCLTEKTDVTPIDPLGHDWGDWVRTTEPTCLGIGTDTRTCARCGATETRDVEPLGHAWDSEWTIDLEPGCLTAGSKSHHCTRENCDAKNDVTPIDPLGHDWGEWYEVTPATCLAAGTKEHECNRCHITETGSIDKLDHSYTGDPVDNHDGTHSFLCVNGCGLPGGTVSCENTYGAWSEDTATCTHVGEQHRECSVCHHIDSKETQMKPHVWTREDADDEKIETPATCTEQAKYYYTCANCDAVEYNANHTFQAGSPLGHDWTDTPHYVWSNDNHTMTASLYCKNDGTHVIREVVETVEIISKEPSCTETGEATYTATFNNDPNENDYGVTTSFATQTTTSEVDKVAHVLTRHEFVESNCAHTGNIEYWTCSKCGGYFTDKFGIEPTTAESVVLDIIPEAHDWNEWQTGDTDNHIRVCKNDSGHTDSQNHSWWNIYNESLIVPGGNTDPCTGRVECYQTCYICGRTNDPNHVFTAFEGEGHKMPLIHHEAVEADCITAGNSEYWECEACGKYFSDANATTQIENKNSVIVQPSGHDWDTTNPTWYWVKNGDTYDVTVVFTCNNDTTHKQTITATVTPDAGNHPATCTDDGASTWTATATFNNEEYTDTKSETTDAFGHKYDTVKPNTWVWTKDGDTYTAKVTLICANDPTHEIERDAVVSFTTDAPSCTAPGTRHYTAVVALDNGTLATDTKDEDVAVVGHSLVATAAKAATCEEAGYEAYWTCSVCGKLFSDANAENEIDAIVTINALGHDWQTPTYTWSQSGTGYTCTATAVCSRNGQHVKSETATATAQVTQDPTCTEMGKTTYTAEFEDTDFETQTQTLTDVAKVPHTPTKTEAVEATCTVEGHDAYWTCSSCHKIFSDENCDHEIASVTPALDPDNHVTLVHTAQVDATCLANGNIEYWTCNACHQKLVYNNEGKLVVTTDVVIPAGPDYHRFTTHVSAREATCTQQGNVEYWTCAVCGKHFDGNTAAANELTDVSVAANGHTFEHTAAVPATCTVDGNKEYWYCTVCHQYFLTGATNASDTLAVPFSDTIDPMLHHVEKNVEGKAATCITVGNKAYSYCSRCDAILTLDGVDVSLNGWTKSDNANVYTIEALGHAYGDPTWVWADDYSSATATRVCANDASHTLTETDNDIATVVVPKTHTTDGKTTYTAEVTFAFDNKTYTDVVEVVDAASGHHTTKVNAKEATCDAAGNLEYWICNDTGCGKLFLDENALVETTLDAVTIPALGHNWVNPTWTWTMNGDYYTGATLTFTCANDDSHTYAPTVTFTSERTEPDCTTAGKIVYTATATTEAKDNLTVKTYTDTKEVALTKTGHTLVPTAAQDADCLTAGNIAYWTCSTCHLIFSDADARYEITADDTVIPALGHTYDYAHATYNWSADHASCTATATCIRCTATDTETKASTNVVKIAATCEAQGIRVYTADFVNENFATQTYDELIPANGHGTAIPHEGQDATCEEAGYHDYWICSECGKLFKAEEMTPANEIATPESNPIAASGHNWDYQHAVYDWDDTKDPYTCKATVTCLNNGAHKKTETASISAVTVDPTCTQNGSTTYTATFLGDTSIPSKSTVKVLPMLYHDFSESIDRAHVVDATHHNYKCVRCDAYGIGEGASAQADGSVECTFQGDWLVSENESCTEPGSEWRPCDFCSNRETQTRPALTHKVFSVAAQEATCVAIGNKAYTYCERCGLLLTVDGESVESENIKFNSEAAIALYKTEDQLAHDLTATAAVSATCETDGNIAYWTCSRCGKIFSVANPTADTAAITLADTVIPATKHDFTGAVRNNGDETHSKQCTKCDAYGIMVNGTPVKDGKEACYGGAADCENAATCVVCGETYGTKLGHNYILQNWTWTGYESAVAHYVCTNDTNHTKDVTATVDKTDATVTCTAAGQNTYVATATFTDDGRTYTDTDTKTEVVNATGHDWDFANAEYSWDANLNCTVTLHCLNDDDHVYTEVGKNTTTTTPASCEGTGNVKYVASFTISDTLTSEHNETLAALGHNWGSPAWTWTETADGYDVEAAFVCKRNDEHTRTLTATVTKDETAPTCENEGRILYTASVTLDGRTYKDTKLTVQDAIGHDWQAPVFTWTGNSTDGYTAATALFACGNDSTHNQTLNCALTYVTDDATCTSGGTVTYTATVTFNGTSYTDTKTATVDELGHNYEFAGFDWSYNEETKVWTATVANFVCANDNSHTETAPATVTTETVAAICEADGKTTYTAKATFKGVEYTDTRVVVLPMLHHNWGDITYTWVKDGDQYKVTALRVCANNPNEHQQTETVTTTSEITESSGCESEGTLRYTATFHDPFTTQYKEEAVAVTGHTLVHTAYQDSTCTEPGNIEYWRCSVCDKIFTDEIASTTSCIGTDLAATVISAKGHDFVMEGDGMVARDNNDGTHSFKCSRCDAYGIGTGATAEVDGKVAHAYGEWVVTVEPTCKDKGEKERVCSVCGNVEKGENEYAPHTLYGIKAKSATCTTAGNIAYYFCQVCGKFFTDNTGATEIVDHDSVVLPATGHDFSGAIRNNGDGTHSYLCVNGCRTYGNAEAHVFDQEIASREYLRNYANCTEPNTYYKSCKCGEKGTETFSIGDAAGHIMISFPAQAATCLQPGHTPYTECSRCNYREGYEVIDATGHGAYYYDEAKSGALSNGTMKWEAYSCENGCGDYYLKTTITSLDANGNRVPNVNVRITGANGTNITGTTDNNGDLRIGTDYKTSLHPGTYTVYLEYVKDGSNYNTHGTVTLGADGKVTGSFGTLTPYGGNASGSYGGKPTGEFRCSMCDLNDSMKNRPVIGWFVSIIHAFVHAISRIGK